MRTPARWSSTCAIRRSARQLGLYAEVTRSGRYALRARRVRLPPAHARGPRVLAARPGVRAGGARPVRYDHRSTCPRRSATSEAVPRACAGSPRASSRRSCARRSIRFRTLPIGGAGLLEVSAELRDPPYVKILGFPIDDVVFLDGGDVTFAADELDPKNLHWATGVGLRVRHADRSGRARHRVSAESPEHDDAINPDPGTTFYRLLAVGEAF